MRSALLYNLGRVISYTVIGAILGFAGMLIGGGSGVGISIFLQGILKIIAGIFMVLMGINMLGIFPGLRRFIPQIPRFLAGRVNQKKAGNRQPFIVGMLNGLMPCGPLQSMQIVALASGNPLAGAFSMFMFSLGTVPLMLGLGSFVSLARKTVYETGHGNRGGSGSGSGACDAVPGIQFVGPSGWDGRKPGRRNPAFGWTEYGSSTAA